MAEKSNAWMETFSDLLLLMLTFFVLLLTMSTMDPQKTKQMDLDNQSGFEIQRQLHGRSVFKSMKGSSNVKKNMRKLRAELARVSSAKPTNQQKVDSQLAEIFKASDIAGKAWLDFRPDGVSINLDGMVAFKDDTAKLTKKAKIFLQHFATIVRPKEFNIAIQVYVKSGKTLKQKEKHWLLALSRADSTLQYLFDHGVDPGRSRMMGYAPSTIESKNEQYMKSGSLLELRILAGPPNAEAPG